MNERTCKRCSVTRVNALVSAYRLAHAGGDETSLGRLRQVARAVGAELPTVGELLRPGLADQDLRALCWNVSSFLGDEQAEHILGVKLKPPGRP